MQAASESENGLNNPFSPCLVNSAKEKLHISSTDSCELCFYYKKKEKKRIMLIYSAMGKDHSPQIAQVANYHGWVIGGWVGSEGVVVVSVGTRS